MMTIKGHLLLGVTILKRFSLKFDLWGIKMGSMLILTFLTPKGHFLAWKRVLWVIARQNPIEVYDL